MKDFFEIINIDDEFIVVKSNNRTNQIKTFKTKFDNLNIQFHFCIDKDVIFKIIKGTYNLKLTKNESLFFFNPKNIIPIDALIPPESSMFSILFSLKKFHSFFIDETFAFESLEKKYHKKKLYVKKELLPNEIIILNQILNNNLDQSLQSLYIRGKVMEFLSHYFNKNDSSSQKCPHLKDEKNVEKIRKAKQIIIEKMNEPPSLDKLANEIGLPINVLKKGFKNIYGEPVYQFLFNYKMELSRQLLLSNQYNVKEISYKMGYSAPTHFVVAFKKKYGTTPKKYIDSL